MVQVTSYEIKQKKDGTSFITLQLTSSVELVQSQNGNFYATVRKCNIPSTLEESVAKMTIGQQIEGDIVRVAVEPYEFISKQTGEVMQLQHSYAYRPKGSVELLGETKIQKFELEEF